MIDSAVTPDPQAVDSVEERPAPPPDADGPAPEAVLEAVIEEGVAVEEEGSDGVAERDRTRGPGRDLPDFARKKKEPRTFEEKLRAYKKQSQERLLDIKRSRENKLGGKKGGAGGSGGRGGR